MRFSLQQFSAVFEVRNPAGRPYILIGGQAVNYWAERFLTREPELQSLMPFTSEDIDFKGSRADVERFAEQLQLTPGYPPKVALTALAGIIPFHIGNLRSSIEVVRTVPGVSGSVESLAVQAEWAGKTIRVLDPVSLLACKLALATSVAQANRRDADHLRILVPCLRAFLREFLMEVEHGHLPVKGWLGAASRVLKLTSSVRAHKAARQFGINWAEILPMDEIAASNHKKLVRFRELELPRWKPGRSGNSVE